jgi:hypothetical protein
VHSSVISSSGIFTRTEKRDFLKDKKRDFHPKNLKLRCSISSEAHKSILLLDLVIGMALPAKHWRVAQP